MSPDDLRTELGRRGLSVRQAAAVLRLSPSYVGRLMRGERSISHDRAELIRLRLAEVQDDRMAQAPQGPAITRAAVPHGR